MVKIGLRRIKIAKGASKLCQAKNKPHFFPNGVNLDKSGLTSSMLNESPAFISCSLKNL